MSRVAIVTGAGRGIGAATARLLAASGCSLALGFVANERAAQALALELGQAGTRALPIQADVASEPDVVRLFETVDRELGRVSVLVNNAGVVDQQARVEQFTNARLERMFRINVIGSMLCAREAVRRMSTNHGGQGGVIVNVSSAAARHGSPGEYVDYAAAKGAIDVFTLGLAREVAREGIRVNAVRPGIIATEIHASGGVPDRVARLSASIPAGRAGSAHEVAEAIVWLASDAASYCQGSILDVAGGR